MKNKNKDSNYRPKYLSRNYWINLKNLLQCEELYMPFIRENINDCVLVNIFKLAIDGKYSDKIIFNEDENYNKELNKNKDCYYIIFGLSKKSIKAGKLIVIDFLLFNKITSSKSTSDTIRSIIYRLLTDKVFYKNYGYIKQLQKKNSLNNIKSDKNNEFDKYLLSYNQIQKICNLII